VRAIVHRFGSWWLDRRLRTGLDGLFTVGTEQLSEAAAHGPIVVACTHQSWWDGPIAVWLCQHLGLRATIPMRSDNLEVYPFFRAFGAVGAEGTSGLRAALRALRAPGDVVWIFPQGRHQDPSEPLRLERGAVWLAEKARCPVFPVALGYRFVDRPEVRARMVVGAPVAPTLTALEQGLLACRSRLVELDGDPAVVRLPALAVGPDLSTRLVSALWRWTWTR
jgi:1-acyl-sn-glycerol-3-phosphate acyltransferase